MPSLAKHQSNSFTKTLFIGDAKAGKTSALVSLVKAGYWLGILDYDNLLDPLKHLILRDCPDKIGNVEFRSLRDKHKHSALGPVIDGAPKAFSDGIKMIDHWKYKTEEGEEIDYGRPAEWGPSKILVLDSLSRFCDAAYDFREPLTPKGPGGQSDGRAIYGDAQDAVESTLAHLTSPSYRTNVLVIGHILYQQTQEGIKGFPQGVGQALSPRIPQYFPVYIRAINRNGKRVIKTDSTPLIDLATPKPDVTKELPLETGLATLFEELKGDTKQVAPAAPLAKPQSLTLRRAQP